MADIFMLKAGVEGFVYRNLIRNTLFLIDAERVHKWFITIGRALGSNNLSKLIVRKMLDYESPILRQEILGIKFRNPIGLATGFDKDAEMISIMEDVGFGFSDVGSISAKPCRGNEGERMWREKKEKSLRIYLGLNNPGAEKVSSRLSGKKFGIPFGISTALTNCRHASEDEMIKDYLFTLKQFNEKNTGDYFVINISCPSARGGMPFSEPKLYEKLIKEIDKLEIKKPIFIKMSPDLEKDALDKIIAISEKHKVGGFICSNLTKNHNLGKGGLSGKYLEKHADNLLSYMYKKTKGKFVLIGVGGIFSAEDAYKKIKLGANLVQLITGMIYQGPQVVGEINYGLAKLLKRDGYKNLSEAVGKGI